MLDHLENNCSGQQVARCLASEIAPLHVNGGLANDAFVIDGVYQRAQRASLIAYIDTLWADESEGDRQVTDRRNQHRLSNDTSVSDARNRWITGERYVLQQIFFT